MLTKDKWVSNEIHFKIHLKIPVVTSCWSNGINEDSKMNVWWRGATPASWVASSGWGEGLELG